jgi:hypothetical protein
MREYETPEVKEHGSVESITEQNSKVGDQTDTYTQQGIPVDGSIQPNA